MELYTAGTGNGQRAAIAVNECGVSCEMQVLNLGQGDQKAADYLKINPTARIPALIDPEGPGGKPLTVTQSWAILMYLCEKTGKYLPADPVARVLMFQWMAEGAADYAPTNQNIFFLGNRMPEQCQTRRSSFTRIASSICGALPTSSLLRRNIWPATKSPPPIWRSTRSMPAARCFLTVPG